MNLKKIILLLALIILTAANVEAAENDLPFDTIATTYAEGETDAISLIKGKTEDSMAFLVAGENIQGVALIMYSRKVYDFYLNKDSYGYYSPLIFEMFLPGQERGQLDEDLGEWKEISHVVPVYALFEVEDGKVICQKPFYSATMRNPSHYHATIKNPTHERLIEVFMTQMPRLHEIVNEKNISLP